MFAICEDLSNMVDGVIYIFWYAPVHTVLKTKSSTAWNWCTSYIRRVRRQSHVKPEPSIIDGSTEITTDCNILVTDTEM